MGRSRGRSHTDGGGPVLGVGLGSLRGGLRAGNRRDLPPGQLRVAGPRPTTRSCEEARLVSFRCSCSRERVVNMLRLLGHQEVQSILDERGNVEVNCEFCNRRYDFDPVDAEQVFAADVVTRVGSTRH